MQLPIAGFNASALPAVENPGFTVTLRVDLSAPATFAGSVGYFAIGISTATSGADYTLPAGTLDFAVGETSKVRTRLGRCVAEDSVAEPDCAWLCVCTYGRVCLIVLVSFDCTQCVPLCACTLVCVGWGVGGAGGRGGGEGVCGCA